MKIKLKTIESGQCPYCSSANITYGSLELSDEMVYYLAVCDDCHRNFTEWYRLEFDGHNVGTNCQVEVHPSDVGMEIEM